MPAMKTYSLVLSCVSAILVAASASAMSGTSLQQGALFTGDSGKAHDNLFDGGPRALSVGVYLASQKRGMVEDGMTSEWEIRHSIAYLGLDLTPWLTILGGGGQSDLSIAGDNRGADFEWLGAIQWRMFDYLAFDPLFSDGACRVSVDAEFRGIGSQSEGMGGDLTWLELFGALTMSFTVNTERNEILDSISVFAGPAYSTITATRETGLNVDLNEDESLGFVAGLQVNPSENVTLRLEFQEFDSGSFGGSCTFHF